MSEEELDALCMSIQEMEADDQLILRKYQFLEIMERNGINLEELRKIQDKHYEIDIEFELARDLYDKQRIRDVYLQEHQEDNQLLNNFYDKKYRRAKHNKFATLIYKTPYQARDIRSNYRSMWFTTLFTTGMLAFIHPALPLVLAYDYWLLLGATKVLNRTATLIMLDVTKRHLMLNKLNFLGYYREENRRKVNLSKIKYIGEFQNTYITMRHMGLLPSMQRMFRRDKDESKED